MAPGHGEFEGGVRFNPDTGNIVPSELPKTEDEAKKETEREHAGQPPHKVEIEK
ncbi:MAG: hypothetical protein WCT27_04910 [Patescibacteria group bacterium]|jgi:hypothetical protein